MCFLKASYLASIFEGVVGAIWNMQLTNKWIGLLSHTWNKIPILPAVLLGFLVYAVAFEWPLVIVFSRKKILTKMKNTTLSSLALYLACHESLNLYINAEVICNKQNPSFFFLKDFLLTFFILLKCSIFSKHWILLPEQGQNQSMF